MARNLVLNKGLDSQVSKISRFKTSLCTSLCKTKLSVTVLALGIFLRANNVLAEGVDALQGNSGTSTSSSSTTSSSALSQSDMQDYIDKARDIIPDATENDTLTNVNNAIEGARAQGWNTAFGITSPLITWIMILADAIWYLSFAFYALSTAVDVLGLTSSFMRSLMSRRDSEANAQGNQFSIGGLISSIFTLSPDAEQVLAMSGLGGMAGTGNNTSAPMNPNGNFGARPNGFGAPNGNFGGGGINPNMPNQSSGQAPVKKTNLLGAYVRKRFGTMVFLSFSLAFFGTSLASNYGANVAGWILSLIQLVFNFVNQFFH